MKVGSRGLVLVFCGLLAAATAVPAQLAVRPDDPAGLSIREGRVRVVHAGGEGLPGSSVHLIRTDPWLAYQMGRSYFQREWSAEEGVFARLPRRPVAGATNSCAMCHNRPFRSPGAGGNTAEPVGPGRNVPHLFGAGLVEILGQQIRAELLARHDANENGFLDHPAETRGRRAVVAAAPGVDVDFGGLDDVDGDGHPDLNDVFLVAPVDSAGEPVRPAGDGGWPALDDPDVAGYALDAGVFSGTVSDHQTSSLRAFLVGVVRTVFGMAVADPVTGAGACPAGAPTSAGVPVRRVSPGGMPQPHLPPLFDTDDPPPGLRGVVTGGELDLLEWYLLNQPAPAVHRQTSRTREGRRLLSELGCTGCHVADWRIRARDPETGAPGDRRFFDLRVRYDDERGGLAGALRIRALGRTTADGDPVVEPARGGFTVRGIYTDFRHHDLGARFRDYTHAGSELRVESRFRTAPLWGVGSTAPYGHDGASPTLRHVIRRHGGEAAASRAAFVEASPRERRAVVAYLRSLVLYRADVLPTDLDGDGRIASRYRRGGREVGAERFNPELLFRAAPRYRGWISGSDGETRFSYALENLTALYRRDLRALTDRDGDRNPDLPGPHPDVRALDACSIDDRRASPYGGGDPDTPLPDKGEER